MIFLVDLTIKWFLYAVTTFCITNLVLPQFGDAFYLIGTASIVFM